MIRRERRLTDKTEIHTRYYISRLEGNAQRFLQVIRAQWGIENSVHWVLDIAFNEDQSRLHKDNEVQNLAIIRHIALNLLRNEKTAKGGIRAKHLQAGWDENTSSKSSPHSAIALGLGMVIPPIFLASTSEARYTKPTRRRYDPTEWTAPAPGVPVHAGM
jgi:predicted transposase YbfD/YdcC